MLQWFTVSVESKKDDAIGFDLEVYSLSGDKAMKTVEVFLEVDMGKRKEEYNFSVVPGKRVEVIV